MSIAIIGGVPGWMEVLVIILVIVLLFGAKRLPELARSLGRSLTEFRKGREEGLPPDASEDEQGEETPKKPPRT